MNTWPNRGAPGGPCGGLRDHQIKHSKEVRSRRSDSSQQASSKPGAVQKVGHRSTFVHGWQCEWRIKNWDVCV